MTSDEFMDLALRVTEGTATPEERVRFEAELIRRPQLRKEWLALRRDLQAVREATAAADFLSSPAEVIPAGRLAGLMGQVKPPAVPRRSLFWPIAGLAAAAAVGLTLWLGSPPANNPGTPTDNTVRLAFVVPQSGEITVATSAGAHSTVLPVPLTGGETVTIPAGREALLLTADGRISIIRGRYQVTAPATGGARPDPRWFEAPLALLGAGPAMKRGSDDIRVLSPRGATAAREPAVHWVAEPGRTYDVELSDALQPAAPPARVSGVIPPLAFHRLLPEPLAVGGIYMLRVAETGRPTSEVSGRFMVVAPPANFADGTDPATVVAAAFQAIAESPARTGDAWLLLQKLPADWRESELGRRLAAAAWSP